MDSIISFLDPRTIIQRTDRGIEIDLIKIIAWILLLYATAGTIAWIL